MSDRINTLAVNLSGAGSRLTCLYCKNPFKGLLKVIVIIRNQNEGIDASLAHKECYYESRKAI